MQYNKLNKTALAAALSLAFSNAAVAQLQIDPDAKIQRVEITGSSIKRTDIEAAGSVQVMTRDDIDRTGATTALEILRTSVATYTGINSATASSGSFATGSSGVDMRQLGKVSTLVLVNGRRIAQYGLSDGAQENFTNLDAIASDAIERIEILKDGASAIYGSDAVAGVVNIILRKEFVGARLKANYNTADGFSDYRNRNASGLFGYGDVDRDGFNTYLSIEGYKRDGYSQGDLASLYPDWHRLTPGRSTYDALSAYSPTGNYFLSSTNIVAAPGCPAANIDPADKQCKFDQYPYAGITTNNKRWAAVSNTHFRIGQSIDANFEITAAGAINDYIVAPMTTPSTTSSSTWYNVFDGKMVGPFFYPKLPVGHPYNPYSTPVELRARLMDTGNGFNFNSTNSSQSRVMLALTGQLGDWDWKSAAGFMDSKAVKATRATSMKGYSDAITNGTYKFNQTNDPALLNTMFPVRTTIGNARIAFIDGTISGEVAKLPAGPLNVAFGTDIRREHYDMKSSDNVLRGDLVGIFGLQVNDTVSHYALFSEATIPVVKKLEASVALRADKSDNAKAHLSPKLGLRYNVLDSLLLRATAAGGFRAPNIVESGNGLGRSSVANGVNDLRRCPIATTLNNLVQNAPGVTASDKALANGYRNADCSSSLPSFVASNPGLKPETSTSLTLGAVFEPIKNTTFALDYYRIERKDEIGTRSVTDILKGEASLPAGQLIRTDNSAVDNEFLALVKKYVPNNTVNYGGVGKLGLVYNPYVNSNKTKVSGFDFDASTRFNLKEWGDLRLRLEGNYTLKYQTFSQADGAYTADQSGTYDFGSKLRVKIRGSWKKGDWDNGMTLNYLSGYSTNSISSPTYCTTQKVAAEWFATCDRVKPRHTLDYNLAYRGIKHVSLSLYINNILKEGGPITWRDGWSPQFRTIGVTGAYTF
ncbi:TonB-dependent receptor [Massilia terrae]|uniref:TonB-dependent receptor n=1 Tax=Massilia terrae TaxID=1811224 RepID=A0ABT2CYZ0_9BURK|nr:TonB-dependent receptor [Massilia terrae]MCS0658791.1 TonB-dependent receptor [Massilia terrae]